MAHGSKKWIRTYDGRIKRSRHRTKDDYYGELKWWESMERAHYVTSKGKERVVNFCPQCKHVQKDIMRQWREAREVWSKLRDEYDRLHGELSKAWARYRLSVWKWTLGQPIPIAPKQSDPPKFWEWSRGKGPETWNYHWRSYLCFKCEWKQEAQREMWYGHMPGMKRHYAWAVREENRSNRAEIRNLMNRAKYDERYYDVIGPQKRGWLD